MLTALMERKSFWEFVPVRTAFLAIAAASFHQNQVEAYRQPPPGCRDD